MIQIAESISHLEHGIADMKSFKQFLSESVTINGDFNGTLNVSGDSVNRDVQEQEEYFADVVWMGSIYRMKLEKMESLRLPTTQELGEQLQDEYPGVIVQRIYPVEQKPTVKIADIKRYHPGKLEWQ
jgi:hypothetical protein